MKAIKPFLIVLTICLAACGVPRYATISSTPDLSKFKYVYITQTAEKTSVYGGAFSGIYGIYGITTSESINPSDIIAGSFMKHGFIRVPEITEEQKTQTLIVTFGESGRKGYAFGSYSIEVTIQLLDATTYELICTATAEGMGNTETDDVRLATQKCLDALFP